MKVKMVVILVELMLAVRVSHVRLKADYRFKRLDNEVYGPEIFKGKPVVVYVG